MITIGIASKDRPEVLDRTLRRIHEFGLSECPLILFDDGSSSRADPPSIELFKNARVLRVPESVGQAGARNRICEAATTALLLQLDDDSYPIEGNIQALLTVALNTTDWLGIAIPFEEPRQNRWPAGVAEDHLIPVRSFVGCSVLLHVRNFRRLGGYAPWIRGMVEEDELAMRGWKAGLSTLSINLLRIRHDVTEVGRSRSGIAYRSFRNWFLTWSLHAPAPIVPIKMFRLLGASLLHSVRHRDLAAVKGIKDAICFLPSVASYRAPLTMSEYRRWRRMPHALDYYSQAGVQVPISKTLESN